MIDWLRYHYQLDRLQRRKRRIKNLHAKAWNQANSENKAGVELVNIRNLERHELEVLDDDIAQLESDYLNAEAEKIQFHIILEDQTYRRWELSNITNRERLNPKARKELRSALHIERKERSELVRSWLASITGLIGVLIGLAAVILGRK
jgi:hypothetical protein